MAQEASFMSDLSHELRAPLTAMRGLLEPLADGMIKDEEKKLRYYNILLAETERLTRLITDMTAKRPVKDNTHRNNKIDIKAMLSDLAYSFSKRADEAGLKIEACSPCGTFALSDSDGVRQMLTVFIENTILHSHRGGVIRLFSQSADEFELKYKNFVSSQGKFDIPSEKIIITVEDNGMGIERYALSHVFERSYSADRLRPDGTGLGLSIAKQIADSLDENIIIQSEPGAGTVISLTLNPETSAW